MTAAARSRLARALGEALRGELPIGEAAERVAVSIDGGLGAAAVAAIAAREGDAAKELEAAMWARRAARSVNAVVHLFTGDATDAELDAHARLWIACQRVGRAA